MNVVVEEKKSKPDYLELSARRNFLTNLTPARKGFITNYPNFQHWKSTDDTEVMTRQPLNVYVHIPFCAQQCSYCYYKVITGAKKSEMDQYVDMICKEIELSTRDFNLANRPLNSVYFGGGTPTFLDKGNLMRIIEALRKHLNFNDQTEFTVEAEPVTLSQKKADILQEIGVTRISLGAQSLSDEIIKLTKRKDTEVKVLKSIDMARATGATVNLDLMSGLVGERDETWEYTLNSALNSGVESITIYKTELYANTEYYRELRKGNLTLPDDEQELGFMNKAMSVFANSDYKPWSFFTFTKNGAHKHVHAPSIWAGQDNVAFGASAFGHVGDWLYQNDREVNSYMASVANDRLPMIRGHKLTCQDKMVREAMFSMKLMELNLTDFQLHHGFKLESLIGDAIQKLQEDDYITVSDTHLKLTHKGMLHGDYTGKALGRGLLQLA